MVLPTPSASGPIPFESGRHKMRPRSGRMTSAKPPLKINETIMEDRHRQPRDCSNPFPGAGAGRLYVAQHRVWKVFASPPHLFPGDTARQDCNDHIDKAHNILSYSVCCGCWEQSHRPSGRPFVSPTSAVFAIRDLD